MYRVGLTGGIASGKSTVSDILAGLGVYIIDADKTAHRVMMPSQAAYKAVVDYFDEKILTGEGIIDRTKLGALIFENEEYKKKLDELVHPFVRQEMLAQEEEAERQGYRVVVWDVPLLIESGWYTQMHEVWIVFVDYQTQLSRLMHRNGFSLHQAEQRIHSQLSLSDKLQFADVVIDNSGDMESTRKQVETAWRGLSSKLKRTATE